MAKPSLLVSWRTFHVARAHRGSRLRRTAGGRFTVEVLEQRLTPATLLPGFAETPVVSGLSSPTTMDFAPDGRLFVLEQTGNLKLVHSDGTTWTALHVNVDSQGERGLLGIAFDPGFSSNHYVYLYYTNPNAGAAPWATGEHNQISRFTVNDANPQQPTLTNEAPILDINNLSTATNHNGGAIHFGLDGMLYADTGDNVQTFTQGGNTYRVAQTLSNLLGKQLRINVAAFNSGAATRDDTTVGHLIPANNPFVGTATGINQLIYVLGLRNPFSFAVQPGTGTIFINDVGENVWEEINQSVAGANYGWSGGNTDGFGQTPPGPGPYHDPLLAYNHSGGPAGGGTALVGSAFYNPATVQFPGSYVGMYFYGDLNGWIRVFDPAHPGSAANPDTSTAFVTAISGGLRDVAVDSGGFLYYLSGAGAISKIAYQAPQITAQPASQNVIQGQGATFTVTATGPSLAYQWQHFVGSTWGNVGVNSPTLTIASATTSDSGDYRVLVSNSFGSTTSNTATLTVTPATSSVALNAGGGAAGAFAADTGFSASTPYATNDAISTAGVTNPAPQAVYQTVRYGTSFTYTIPGLTPGASYNVRLHFAEIYWNSAGQRVFNVAINGTPVLSNFDIFTAAGGKNRAIVQTASTVADSQGRVTILFTTIKDNAVVSGIEIASGTPAAPPAPNSLGAAASNAQVTLSWNPSPGATSYNVYRGTTTGGEGSTPYRTGLTTTSFTDTGLTNGTTYFYQVSAVNSVGEGGRSTEASATPQPAGASVALNAGGGAAGAFAADTGFSASTPYATNDAISTAGVTNPAPQAVYQTVRYGTSFTYTIAGLTPGASYNVRLHFAEIYWNSAGQRLFNVAINGTPVLSNFDIFTAAGGKNRAIVQSASAVADSQGRVTILFTTVRDNAVVSGIEITPS